MDRPNEPCYKTFTWIDHKLPIESRVQWPQTTVGAHASLVDQLVKKYLVRFLTNWTNHEIGPENTGVHLWLDWQ